VDEFPKGVPTLDLQLKQEKIFGHAGCNRFQGRLRVMDDQMTLGPLTSTKMACPNLETEALLLGILSENTFSYRVEEGRLILAGGENELVYKKVD